MKKKTSKSISRILAGILAIAIFTSTNGSFLVWGMSEGKLGFSGEPMVANAITVDEITSDQVIPKAYTINKEIGFLESLWIGINSIFGRELKTGILGDLKQPKQTETTSYAQMKFMINNNCWSPSECEQISRDARDDKLKKENEKIFRVAMADYVARSAIIESEGRYKSAVITFEDVKAKSKNLPNDKFLAIAHINAARDLEEAKLDLVNLNNARDLMVEEGLKLEKLSFFESRRVKKLAIKASDVMIAGQDGFVASFAITHLKYEEPLDVLIAKDDVWYAADRAASKVAYDIVSPGESNNRVSNIFKERSSLVGDLVGAAKGDDLNYTKYEYPEEEKLLDKVLESKKVYLLSDRRSSEKFERMVYEEGVKSAFEDKADKSTSSEVSDDILMEYYEKENIKQFTKEALERRSIGAYKEGDDMLIEDYYSKMEKRPYEAVRVIQKATEEEEEEGFAGVDNGDLSDYYKSDTANSALQARNLRAIEVERGWIATAWDNTFGSWFGGSDKQLNNEELRATAGIRAVGPVDTNTGTNWRRVTANLMEQDEIKGKYGGLSEYMDCESNNCDPIIVTVADSSFAGIDELQHYGAQIEAAYDFNYAGELEAQLRGDSFGDGVEIAQNRHGTIVVAKILSDFAVNGIDTRRVKLKLVSVNLDDSFGYLESALDHAEGSDIFHSSTGWGTNIKVQQAVAKIQANNGPEQERWNRTLNKIETLSKNGTIVSVSAMNSALEDAPLYGSNRSGTVGMSALSSEYAIHWGAVDAYGSLENFSKSGKDGSHSTFHGENRLVDIPGEGEDGVEGAIIAYASQSAERASILAANEYSAKHQLSIDNEAVLSVSKKAYDDSYKANINDRHLREKMTELAVMGQGTSYAHQLGGFIVEKDKLKAELAAAGNDGEIITASDIVTRVRESVAKNPDVYPGILLGHRESTGRFREALSDSFIDNMEEDRAKATKAFISTSGVSTDLATIYVDNIYKYISDPDGALVQLSDFREALFERGIITSRDEQITELHLSAMSLTRDASPIPLIASIVDRGKLANLMNIAQDELDVPASRKITDAEYSRRLIAEEKRLGLMNTTDDSSWVENLNPFNWFSSNVDSDEQKTNQEKIEEMERSSIVAWNDALGDEFGEIKSMKDTDGNTIYLASTGNVSNGIQTTTKVVDVASAAISLYDELVYNPGVYEINSSDVKDVVKEMDKRISKSVNKEIVDGVTNYYDGSRLVYSIEKNGDSVIVKDWQIEVSKNSDTIKSAAVLTQAVAGILGASEIAKIASVVRIEGDNTVGIIDSVVEWIPFVGKLITRNTDQALKERFLAAASKVGSGDFTEAYDKITEGDDWDKQKVNWENNLTVTGVAVDIFEGAKIGRALELITPDEFKNATVEALLNIERGDDVGVVFNEFTSRTGSASVELTGSVKEKIKDDPIVFFAKLAQQSGNTEAQLVTEAMLIAKAVYGDVSNISIEKVHKEIEGKSVIVFNEDTKNALSGKNLDVHFLERGYSIARNPQDGSEESESLRFLKNKNGEIIGRIAPDKSGQDVVFYYKDRQPSTTEKSLGHIKRIASLLGKAGIVDRELANTVASSIEFAGERDNVETILKNKDVDGIAGLIGKYGNSEIREVATIYIDGKKLIGNSSRLLDDINAAIEKSESSKGWFDKLFNKSGGDVEILNTVMSEETLKDLKIALEKKNQIVKIKNGEIQVEDASGKILVIKDESFEVINGSDVAEDKVIANIKDEIIVQQSNFENKDLSKRTSLWEQAEYAYERGQIKKDTYEELLKTNNEFYLDQDKEYSYNTETRTYDECGFFGKMFNGSCQTGNNYKSAKGVIIKNGNRDENYGSDSEENASESIPEFSGQSKFPVAGQVLTDDDAVQLTTIKNKEKIKYYPEYDISNDSNDLESADMAGLNQEGYTYTTGEQGVFSMGSDISGGGIVVGDEFIKKLNKGVENISSGARVIWGDQAKVTVEAFGEITRAQADKLKESNNSLYRGDTIKLLDDGRLLVNGNRVLDKKGSSSPASKQLIADNRATYEGTLYKGNLNSDGTTQDHEFDGFTLVTDGRESSFRFDGALINEGVSDILYEARVGDNTASRGMVKKMLESYLQNGQNAIEIPVEYEHVFNPEQKELLIRFVQAEAKQIWIGSGVDDTYGDYGVEQEGAIKRDIVLSDTEKLNQALRDRDVADLADSNLQARNLNIAEKSWLEKAWSSTLGGLFSSEKADYTDEHTGMDDNGSNSMGDTFGVYGEDRANGSDQEDAIESNQVDENDGILSGPLGAVNDSLLFDVDGFDAAEAAQPPVDVNTQGANAPPEDGSGFDPDFVENVLAAGIQSAGNRVLLMVSQGGNSPEAIANVYLEEIGKKALSATGKALFGDNPLTTVASKLTSIFAFGDVEDSVKAVDKAAGVDLLGSGSQGGSFDSINDFLQSGYGSDIMSAAVSAVKTGDVEGAGKALLSSMAGRYVENVATEYITTGTVDLISTFKPADDLAEGLFGGASSTVAAGAAAAASTLVGQLIMNGKVDLEAVGVVAAKSAATHAITKSLTGTTVGKVLGSTMGAVGGAVVNLVYAAVTGELNVETVVTSVASIATTIIMTEVITAAAATTAASGAAGAAAGTLAGGLTVGGPVGVVVAAVVMIIQGIFRNLSDDPSANELREYAKITQEVFNPSFDFEGLKDGSNEKIIAAVASGDRARVSGAIREAINKSAIGKFSHVVGVSGIVNTIVAIFEDKADRIYGVKRDIEFSEVENFTSTEDASMDLLTRRFIKLKQDLRICYLADNQDCVTDVASKILDLRQLLASRSIEVFSARIGSLNKRIGALTRELNRIEHTLFGEEKRIAKERAEKELERLRMERGELQDASDTAGGLILECEDGTVPYLGWCMTPGRRDELKCTFIGGTYGGGGNFAGIPNCEDLNWRTEGGEGEGGGEGGAGGE